MGMQSVSAAKPGVTLAAEDQSAAVDLGAVEGESPGELLEGCDALELRELVEIAVMVIFKQQSAQPERCAPECAPAPCPPPCPPPAACPSPEACPPPPEVVAPPSPAEPPPMVTYSGQHDMPIGGPPSAAPVTMASGGDPTSPGVGESGSGKGGPNNGGTEGQTGMGGETGNGPP